jgi:glycerophosphoryl diester phosphodiesterase
VSLPASRHLRLAVLAALSAAAVAAGCGSEDEEGAPVEIHAHRGGPLESTGGDVIAVHPENSMSAFRAAQADGFTLELDVKLTADAVPVVMHDSTLDRTTDCRGRVDARTARSLARCRLDYLGTSGNTRPNLQPERVPTLAKVLEWARAEGADLTVEIKDVPPRTVVEAFSSSGIDGEQLVVKSFRPRDLEIARDAGWRTALLTSRDDNAAAPGIASREDFDFVSPQWPLPEGFLDEAGRPVVPWTLNSSRQIEAALRAGVDGIVSDNPGAVRDAIDAG